MLRHPHPRVCLMSDLIMYDTVHTGRKQHWGGPTCYSAAPRKTGCPLYQISCRASIFAQPGIPQNFDTTTPSNVRVGCRLLTKVASPRASLRCANRAKGLTGGCAHAHGFNSTKEAPS